MPIRLWDAVEDIILKGDGSNTWCGGVYNDRKFRYKQAEAAVTHYWRNGQLTDITGEPMLGSLIKPDIIVQVSGTPSVGVPPGGNLFDNTRNMYIDEVEFTMPNGYRLIPYEEEGLVLESGQ
jgi:hypothetical protein